MIKILTNEDIYLISEKLNKYFYDNEVYYSAKINFFIQKNKNVLNSLASEIESCRQQIVLQNGEKQEDGKVKIFPEKIQEVNEKILDLLHIEQEVNIHMINLEDLNDMDFTFAQMNSIMFMIEDNEIE